MAIKIIDLDVRACRQTLDAYLLYRSVTDKRMERVLVEIARSRYHGHLASSGLDSGLPEEESARFQCLLRLRVLFCDYPALSDSLLLDLSQAAALRQSITDYISGVSTLRDLRGSLTQLRLPRRSEVRVIMTQRLQYALSLADAPIGDPYRVSRAELIDTCLITIRQTEDYWHGILGR